MHRKYALLKNQITPGEWNFYSIIQSHNILATKTSFAFHTNLQQIIPFAPHSTNTIQSTLQNEAQIKNFESRNTNQASLAYQKPLSFNKIKQSNLSIKTQSHILFLINTENSNFLNTSRAQLTNNQKSVFAHSQSIIQSVNNSINSIQTSSKMNPLSAIKGKSISRTWTMT